MKDIITLKDIKDLAAKIMAEEDPAISNNLMSEFNNIIYTRYDSPVVIKLKEKLYPLIGASSLCSLLDNELIIKRRELKALKTKAINAHANFKELIVNINSTTKRRLK